MCSCRRTCFRAAAVVYKPKLPVSRPQLDLSIAVPKAAEQRTGNTTPATQPSGSPSKDAVGVSGTSSAEKPSVAPAVSVGGAVKAHYLAKAAAKYAKAIARAKFQVSISSCVIINLCVP